MLFKSSHNFPVYWLCVRRLENSHRMRLERWQVWSVTFYGPQNPTNPEVEGDCDVIATWPRGSDVRLQSRDAWQPRR